MRRVVIALVIAVMVLVGAEGVVVGADEWISPTSSSGTGWSNLSNGYDGNTATYATSNGVFSGDWTNEGCFYFDAVESTKVRGYWGRTHGCYTDVRVWVQKESDSSWVKIYDDSLTVGEWVEYGIGSTLEVKGVKVSAYHDARPGTQYFGVYEIEVWALGEEELVATSVLVAPESGEEYVDEEYSVNATVYDQYSEVMSGVNVTWSITSGPGEFVSYDSVTDGSGVADGVVTSSSTGTTVVKCAVSTNSSVYDSGEVVWSLWPSEATTVELVPVSGEEYVDEEYGLTGTVYDQYSEVMSGVNVTWSMTSGPGWFVSSDGETDGSGEVGALVSSNVTGTTVVKCAVSSNSSVYDTAEVVWSEAPLTGPVVVTGDVDEVGDSWVSVGVSWMFGDYEWLEVKVRYREDGSVTWNYTAAVNYTEALSGCFNLTGLYDGEWEYGGVGVYGDGTGYGSVERFTVGEVEGGVGLPAWYPVVLVVIVGLAWWCRSMVLSVCALALCVVGWAMVWSLEVMGFVGYGVGAFFLIVAGFVIMLVIRRNYVWT